MKEIIYRKGGTTVCLLAEEGEVLARGISVCSKTDQFCRKTGKVKALGRARQAIYHQANASPIRDMLSFGDLTPLATVRDFFDWKYKAFWKPQLTKYEQELVSKLNGNGKSQLS